MRPNRTRWKIRIELIVIALGIAALLPLFLIASASPAERDGSVRCGIGVANEKETKR